LIALGLLPACVFPPVFAGKNDSATVAGVYRCWHFNVGGAGKRCTSPPLELRADGTYRMSSERGTYTIQRDRIVLSESKIRGPGRMLGGDKIVFEYTYKGLAHTVTYLRQPPGTAR
jgi:hypothetical protein